MRSDVRGEPTEVRPLADAPFVDPLDPAVQADPGPVFDALRARAAVARTPLGVSVLSRDAVHQALSDPNLVSAVPFLARLQAGDEVDLDFLGATVIAMDGPDHTRLRRLVARAFTPRAADRRREEMRRCAKTLVDPIAARGSCEFMSEFADRYPITVMCEVLGVPTEDHHLFAQWGEAITFVLSLELAAHLDEIVRAAEEMGEYVDRLIEDRRAAPRDDLVSDLVRASEDGDRLTDLELRAMIGALLFAGFDTTRNQLGHALAVLAERPDDWARLVAQPDLAARAIDEMMRLHGAVAAVPRLAAAPTVIAGWEIPAGTLVILAVAAANRDEWFGPDASRFDIETERPPHLSFGGGPHYCLGVHLARAEMEEALQVLTARLPGLRLDGEVEWRMGTGITGPARLPLAFTA
jgi:cytochrome P450